MTEISLWNKPVMRCVMAWAEPKCRLLAQAASFRRCCAFLFLFLFFYLLLIHILLPGTCTPHRKVHTGEMCILVIKDQKRNTSAVLLQFLDIYR